MNVCKLLKIIEKTICEKRLICENDKVLVAFSGGSDSVFLLYALYTLREKYGYTIAAAHLNHSIRSCADAEENFSAEFCKEYNIDFYSKKEDILKIADDRGISSETAGREERYAFFEELKNKYGFNKIATAHHMDDNAETVLMHFIRGSGANGLKGIEYMRDNLIIRPLLDITKQDIYDACDKLKLKYVTDKSNFESVYTRNKIRLELIPQIKRFNPNFARTICENGELFAEDEEFLEDYSEKIFKENFYGGFPCEILKKQPKAIQRRIIRLLYKNVSGFDSLSKIYTDSILNLKSGGRASLPKGITAYNSGGKFIMIKDDILKKEYEYKAILGIKTDISEYGEYWTVNYAEDSDKNVFCAPENAEFTIRNRRKGDRFYPKGLGGSKSISNFFTDKKIPLHIRNIIPILTVNGEIVNVGGKYHDERFYKKDKTDCLYKLEIIKKSGSDVF